MSNAFHIQSHQFKQSFVVVFVSQLIFMNVNVIIIIFFNFLYSTSFFVQVPLGLSVESMNMCTIKHEKCYI